MTGLVFVVVTVVVAVAVVMNWSKLNRLRRVNSLFTEKMIVVNFSDMRDMFFNTSLPAGSDTPAPLPHNKRAMPAGFEFRGKDTRFEDWLTERAVTAIVVLKDGEIAHEAYLKGTSEADLRISWSMGKSVLSAAFGIAVGDGLLPDLNAQVTDYVPELKGSAYEGVTIQDVLYMSSGVEFDEDYLAFNSDINKMGRVLALGRSMDKFAAGVKKRAREPGSERQYVSIDTHVLGMVLRSATGIPMAEYLTEKLLKPMRPERDPYYLTDGYGVAFVLGGLNLTTRDYARFGQMFLQDGKLNGVQIIPADWVRASTTNTAPLPFDLIDGTEGSKLGYGYQWWTPPEAGEGEFFALGIYGQYIYVNRPLGVVIAVNGADRQFRDGDGRVTLENIAMFRTIAAHLNE